LELEIGASGPEKSGRDTRPSTLGAGGAITVTGVCGAGTEPTWHTGQAAASAALLCVCQIPVAAIVIVSAKKTVPNNKSRRDLCVLPSIIIAATTPVTSD